MADEYYRQIEIFHKIIAKKTGAPSLFFCQEYTFRTTIFQPVILTVYNPSRQRLPQQTATGKDTRLNPTKTTWVTVGRLWRHSAGKRSGITLPTRNAGWSYTVKTGTRIKIGLSGGYSGWSVVSLSPPLAVFMVLAVHLSFITAALVNAAIIPHRWSRPGGVQRPGNNLRTSIADVVWCAGLKSLHYEKREATHEIQWRHWHHCQYTPPCWNLEVYFVSTKI